MSWQPLLSHACQSEPLHRLAVPRCSGRQRCSHSLNSPDLNNLPVKAGGMISNPGPRPSLGRPGSVRWAARPFEKKGQIGRRLAAALLPRLSRVGKNPRSHHKGATGRVGTEDQRLPVLCHCQLGQVTNNVKLCAASGHGSSDVPWCPFEDCWCHEFGPSHIQDKILYNEGCV